MSDAAHEGPSEQAVVPNLIGGTSRVAVSDLIAAVRAGVESGTIKGEEMSVDKGGKVLNKVMLRPGDYLVIPVNGGE